MHTTLQTNHRVLFGTGFVIIGTLLFSIKGIFIKLAYQYSVDAATLMTLRMLIALPIYLLIGFWHTQRTTRRPLRRIQTAQVFGIGVIGYYMASYLDLSGLTLIGAGLERLILYLYPSIVLLLSALLFKQRPKSRQLIAFALGYLGVFLFLQQERQLFGDEIDVGVVLVAASALCFAVFMLFSGKMIPAVGSVRFTTMAMSAASLAIFLHYVLINGATAPNQPIQVWGYATLIAIVSTVIPSFLMSAGIERLGATQASLLGAVGPAGTMLIAVLFLHEPFSLSHFFGMLLVIAAVVLSTRVK